MNKFICGFSFVVGCICLTGTGNAAPVTQVSVSHPTTQAETTRPTTAVAVNRPTTDSSVSHPQTTVSVDRPSTAVNVSHPVTEVTVFHPETENTSADTSAGSSGSGSQQRAVSAKTVAAGTASAGAKPSMMSTYQAPQAKDFKAAKLGGGEAGLGKINEAEKDAAAASFKLPKGEEVSAKSVLENKGSNIKSKVNKAIENKK